MTDVVLPAIGGLILGVMGLLVPRTFGVGYEVAVEVLNDELSDRGIDVHQDFG